MRYFFHIGYHGINYRGWQRQPAVTSVQEVLETSLSKILKETITVNGCGRTDAQVHASQYFFHCDVKSAWEFDLKFRLNHTLPDDIAVFDIIPMDDNRHARFDAIQRSYDYFLHFYKDPFLVKFSSYYRDENLDIDAMQRAAALLVNYDDYFAFCRSPEKYEHTICHVSSSEIIRNELGNKLCFRISSNRFLGSMIRILVGKFLEIGRGELSVEEFESYFHKRESAPMIIPAHPQGLYLSKVTYPYLDLAAQPNFTFLHSDLINQ